MMSVKINSTHLALSMVFVLIPTLIISLDHFPYADGVNHLARYAILNDILFHQEESLYQAVFETLPTSYIFLDIVFASSLLFITPYTLGKFIAIIAALLPTYGLYRLSKAIGNTNSSIVVLGAGALALNWYYFFGFMNYLIGLGGALIFLAWWWNRKKTCSLTHYVCIVLSAVALYLTHLSALSIVLVVTWLYGLFTIFDFLKQKVSKDELISTWIPALLLFAVGIVLFVTTRQQIGHELQAESQLLSVEFRSIFDKLKQTMSPFFSFSFLQMLVMFLTWLTAALAVLLLSRQWTNFFFISSIVFFALFFMFPAVAFSAYDADVRYLLPGYMFLLLAPRSRNRNKKLEKSIITVIFCLFVINFVIIGKEQYRVDQDLRDYTNIIQTLPPNARAVGIATATEYGRVNPYLHFILWNTATNNGWSNGLFHRGNVGAHIGHFVVNNQPYHPPEHWDTTPLPQVRWDKVVDEYDYIIVAGNTSEVRPQAENHGTLIGRQGNVYLYKITTPGEEEVYVDEYTTKQR